MRKTKFVILTAYYILLAIALIIFNTLNDIGLLAYWLLTAAMPLLPMIVTKITKWKFNDLIISFYNLFVLFSMILGSIFNFYRFLGYDKFLHTLSGILISASVFMLYCYLKGSISIKDKNELSITVLFTLGVNEFIAFLWECFEFILLVFFDNDAIHHYDQGVYDTMNDMIVCFMGAIITIIFIYHFYKTKKENLLIKATRDLIDK